MVHFGVQAVLSEIAPGSHLGDVSQVRYFTQIAHNSKLLDEKWSFLDVFGSFKPFLDVFSAFLGTFLDVSNVFGRLW